MQGRLRVLIIVALVIIIGAVAAVLLIGGGGNDGGDTTQQTDSGQPAEPGVEAPPTNTPAPTPTPLDLVDIVVAVQAISRGSVIPPGSVELRPYPRDIVPFNALSGVEALDQVIGQRARTDIFIEQPILVDFVVPDLFNLADTGSDLAALLPLGLRAVTLPIDQFTSVAYGIQPGDRVDVIVSLLYVDIDEEFQSILPNTVNLFSFTANEENNQITISTGEPLTGRFETRRIIIPVVLPDFTITQRPADLPVVVSPSEEARPRLVTQNTIQDALVAWVGEFPANGSLFAEPPTPTVPVPEDERTQQEQAQNEIPPTQPPPRPNLVTLAVTPQEAVILTYLVEARLPITFALRPAADTTGQPTDPVTLDYIMNQYSITVPPKRGFSVQPAIRSIRQLITDTQISGN